MRKLLTGAIAGIAATLLVATPALAQRDPAYDAARSAGQVGEKMDGYLGIVGASNASLQRIVDDINIKRRSIYAEKAKEKKDDGKKKKK